MNDCNQNIYIAPLQCISYRTLRWPIWYWMSSWTDKFNRLAKLSTVSWKNHKRRAHAHVWNQPTDSNQQLTNDVDVQNLWTRLWMNGWVGEGVGECMGSWVDE